MDNKFMSMGWKLFLLFIICGIILMGLSFDIGTETIIGIFLGIIGLLLFVFPIFYDRMMKKATADNSDREH